MILIFQEKLVTTDQKMLTWPPFFPPFFWSRSFVRVLENTEEQWRLVDVGDPETLIRVNFGAK